MLALLEHNAEGAEIVAQPVAEEPAKVVDLMAALEASLAAAKSNRSAEAGELHQPSPRNTAFSE